MLRFGSHRVALRSAERHVHTSVGPCAPVKGGISPASAPQISSTESETGSKVADVQPQLWPSVAVVLLVLWSVRTGDHERPPSLLRRVSRLAPPPS